MSSNPQQVFAPNHEDEVFRMESQDIEASDDAAWDYAGAATPVPEERSPASPVAGSPAPSRWQSPPGCASGSQDVLQEVSRAQRFHLQVVHANPSSQRLVPVPGAVSRKLRPGDIAVSLHALVNEDPPIGSRTVRSSPAIIDDGSATIGILSHLGMGDTIEKTCWRWGRRQSSFCFRHFGPNHISVQIANALVSAEAFHNCESFFSHVANNRPWFLRLFRYRLAGSWLR